MSEYDANGFSVEVAETPKKKRAPRGEKTEQQKIAEERAAQYPYKWPVDDQELREVKDRRLRQIVVRNAIQYARRHAAINARKYMDECGIPPSVICKDIGILQDTLFHAVNDELFSMPTDALVKFCYKYLHMSVQEFLFGKSKPTLLPRKLQTVARKLYEYQEEGPGQTEGHAKLCTIQIVLLPVFCFGIDIVVVSRRSTPQEVILRELLPHGNRTYRFPVNCDQISAGLLREKQRGNSGEQQGVSQAADQHQNYSDHNHLT